MYVNLAVDCVKCFQLQAVSYKIQLHHIIAYLIDKVRIQPFHSFKIPSSFLPVRTYYPSTPNSEEVHISLIRLLPSAYISPGYNILQYCTLTLLHQARGKFLLFPQTTLLPKKTYNFTKMDKLKCTKQKTYSTVIKISTTQVTKLQNVSTTIHTKLQNVQTQNAPDSKTYQATKDTK